MRINKHDTQGTKPLLGKGELGYDDYTAGGDVGRVYVGTGTENIALAEKLEANLMTKAQFNALAEERKANRAGSGFENFGKHNSSAGVTPINEGMHVWSGASNYFYMGESNSTLGSSKTLNPYVCINGILSKVSSINATASNVISLPTAPNIYPYDTVLTAEQIASGVIKHADASNSGLIFNGKFDTDTSGWTANNATLSVENNKLKVVDGGAYSVAKQSFTTVIGKKYIIEFDVTNNTDGRYLCGVHSSSTWDGATATNLLYVDGITSTTGSTRKSYEFVATSTTSMLMVGQIGTVTCYFDNIAVYPADAISRSDLVFLESFHEDVSEKNFVYPLGNVQYLGANTDGLTGIANGAFTGFETYSLFGNFQAPSGLIGKGYIWSNLTEAQKRAFIANPENNCYLDGDKTIQVRYRVRVVQGLGDSYFSGGLLYYSDITGRVYTNNDWLKPKGKLVSITNDLADYSVNETGYYSKVNTDFLKSTEYASDYGLLVAIVKADKAFETQTSYNGRNFAILLCSTHRRNQGMYHPVYNPNGTKKASDGNFWYNTAVSFTSISDCFDPAKLLTASGYIGSVSGRPDGLFYDQVHESDILDLRNSSKKVEDYNRLINREFNKLVAGTYRGKEGEWQISTIQTTTISAKAYFGVGVGNGTKITFSTPLVLPVVGGTIFKEQLKNSYKYFLIHNNDVFGINYVESANGVYIYKLNIAAQDYTDYRNNIVIGGECYLVYCTKSTRTKSNTLLHCDIIGNPTNYPTSWKQSEVFGTPLIVAEDGTSLLPDGVRDTFKLSRKANATPLLCLRSTDSGATWTSFTPTFSTTTNAITLTDEPAGNLVMVYYQTKTSMAVPTVNSAVMGIGDIYTTQGQSVLINTLINKSGASLSETTNYMSKIVQLVEKPVLATGGGLDGKMLSQNFYGYNPSHSAITLYQNTNTPTVKVFPYLTSLNGKAYLNLVFKEMKYNGTSWGDDAKFNIVDNISTTTDNNAQTVLIGQKTVELPYFIGADE